MGFPCLGSLSACMRNAKGTCGKEQESDALFQTGQPDAGGAGDRHVRDPFV